MNPDLTSHDHTDADTRDQQSYLSYDQLDQIIKDVRSQIREPAEGSRREREVELIKQLRERLIAEKDKFKHVFTSETVQRILF